MTKQEIKDILKKHGYTVISKSWYFGKPEEESVLFTAYDKSGTCYMFFVSWAAKYARCQMLSAVSIHEPRDMSSAFFKEACA